MNSGQLYEFEYPSPLPLSQQMLSSGDSPSTDKQEGTTSSHQQLPLLIALHGYADAGQAVLHASTHLTQALEHSTVATFHVDELLDYRSRRPGITLEGSRIVSREDISLTLELLQDTDGDPFLLLSGPEPDLRWEAFSDSVVDLVQRTGATQIVTLYAAPMTVPHTRPLVVTGHASEPYLVAGLHNWDSRMIIPGSAALDTELKLTKHGHQTIGLSAHVPHYIAASDYPEATLRLLQEFQNISGRHLPLASLESEAERLRIRLDEQTEESAEIAGVVQALEARYDAEAERTQEITRSHLLEPGQDVPTGEELGAELEAFLANLDDTHKDESTNDES